MSDYPDGTYPVDIVAQTLTDLNVDIVAQTLANLKVDVNAQTLARVAVDIAAQTLSSLDINITAQDLAELVIKIAAQSVGVYLQPEWAALQGDDKTLQSSATNKTWGTELTLSYTVPASTTLYLNNTSFAVVPHDAANYDHHLHFHGWIVNNGVVQADLGGNGGGLLIFPKPITVTTGNSVVFHLKNYANIATDLYLCGAGYEVS